MSAVAKVTPVPPAPRCGSAVAVAAYTGLSLKTVRRRLADGSLCAIKIGRRGLIPFDQRARRTLAGPRPPEDEDATPMATAPSPAPPRRSVDAHGRALPMTDAETRARAEEIARGLDALDDMGDPEEQRQSLDALLAALDE